MNETESDQRQDADEKLEAQVSLWIQMAMAFFCLLIVAAVFMAMKSHNGYWVVILVCLTILVSLVLGLCCFLQKVLNEEDAPRVNQKHMPKWYRDLTKMIKKELDDFREDWMDMCNNVYLLEDGDAGTSVTNTLHQEQAEHVQQSSDGIQKPKKKRGKSALFKLVAKPAAVLAGFRRRKRKDKRRQKKGQPMEQQQELPPFV